MDMSQAEWLEELAAQIENHGINKLVFWLESFEGSEPLSLEITDVKHNDGNIEVTLA